MEIKIKKMIIKQNLIINLVNYGVVDAYYLNFFFAVPRKRKRVSKFKKQLKAIIALSCFFIINKKK